MPDTVPIQPEILTAEEVAKLFRCTPRMVTKWAVSGVVPGRQIGGKGGRWLFDRKDVLRVFDSAKRIPEKENDAA
jgi:hypothetical protein